MKYEKVIYLLVVCLFFFGCSSTNVHDNGNGIADVRENMSELENEQRNIDERIGEVADGVETLENDLNKGFSELEERLGESINSLTERTDDFTEFERILESVRKRKTIDTE